MLYIRTWKNHFETLLNNKTTDDSEEFIAEQLFDLNENICTDDFSHDELNTALRQMKTNKATGLDGLYPLVEKFFCPFATELSMVIVQPSGA